MNIAKCLRAAFYKTPLVTASNCLYHNNFSNETKRLQARASSKNVVLSFQLQ